MFSWRGKLLCWLLGIWAATAIASQIIQQIPCGWSMTYDQHTGGCYSLLTDEGP